jgi:hypothetical protein
MSILVDKVNSSSELENLPLRTNHAEPVGAMSPVMATPAAFAAGVAGAAAVAGAITAGIAIGDAID